MSAISDVVEHQPTLQVRLGPGMAEDHVDVIRFDSPVVGPFPAVPVVVGPVDIGAVDRR